MNRIAAVLRKNPWVSLALSTVLSALLTLSVLHRGWTALGVACAVLAAACGIATVGVLASGSFR